MLPWGTVSCEDDGVGKTVILREPLQCVVLLVVRRRAAMCVVPVLDQLVVRWRTTNWMLFLAMER